MDEPIDPTIIPLVFAALQPGDTIRGVTRVTASESAIARTGDPYHRLTLTDPRGTPLPARRFAVGAEIPPPPGSVVAIAGTLERYRGAVSLKLAQCRPAPAIPVTAFLPQIPPSRAASLADLDDLIDQLVDPAIHTLVTTCLNAAERHAVATHPAAVTHHGAAIGGLLAHTVRMTRIALAFTELLGTACDRDIVLAGALLHDLGKLAEILPEPGAGFTDAGTMIGHVGLGLMRVAFAADSVPSLTPERRQDLLHAIAAAHGTREHGAVVPPATIEATIVHLADHAEATLAAVQEAQERAAPGATWTAYLPRFQTRLRVAGRA